MGRAWLKVSAQTLVEWVKSRDSAVSYRIVENGLPTDATVLDGNYNDLSDTIWLLIESENDIGSRTFDINDGQWKYPMLPQPVMESVDMHSIVDAECVALRTALVAAREALMEYVNKNDWGWDEPKDHPMLIAERIAKTIDTALGKD